MRATLNQAVRFVEVALSEPGSRFGAYVIEHPVGAGGMAIVWFASMELLLADWRAATRLQEPAPVAVTPPPRATTSRARSFLVPLLVTMTLTSTASTARGAIYLTSGAAVDGSGRRDWDAVQRIAIAHMSKCFAGQPIAAGRDMTLTLDENGQVSTWTVTPLHGTFPRAALACAHAMHEVEFPPAPNTVVGRYDITFGVR